MISMTAENMGLVKNIRSRKVLVTGAGGFIGSHLTELLVRSGADVTAFVRYTSTGTAGHLDRSAPEIQSRLKLIHGDIRNHDDVVRAATGADIILHLAAQIAIPYSYLSPGDFINVNTLGSLHVLSAARELKATRVIIVSTSEVYGSAQYLPIDEKHPLVAQSPYAASKIAAEKVAESFCRSFDVPVVIVRPFNAYGPRQSARAIIPTIILQALRGNTIRLGNSDTRRDFNFVEDTAHALATIAVSQKGIGGVFNVATGADQTVDEIVALVGKILGKRLTVKTERRRVRPKDSEVRHLRGDGSSADRLFRLGRRTSLRAGLEKTVAYYHDHLNEFRTEDYQL
jgi:NAD dependent epimerase/dehydratase